MVPLLSLRSLRPALVLAVALSGAACTSDPASLCTKYFEPYPDMVSDRVRNRANGAYLDAMKQYAQGNWQEAISGLEAYLSIPTRDVAPRIYLASAYLAIGEPFKAELQLDFVESSNMTEFRDQVDWYNAICLLCSGQADRAKAQAEWVAAKEHHTYSKEAARLARDL